MNARCAVACCTVLVFMASAIHGVHAERWVQAGPIDSQFWYDTDGIRPTADRLIGVWISGEPNRTNPGTGGMTIYPTYSIINCRERTAGSKISIDLGQAPQPFAASLSMGELIAKLCS